MSAPGITGPGAAAGGTAGIRGNRTDLGHKLFDFCPLRRKNGIDVVLVSSRNDLLTGNGTGKIPELPCRHIRRNADCCELSDQSGIVCLFRGKLGFQFGLHHSGEVFVRFESENARSGKRPGFVPQGRDQTPYRRLRVLLRRCRSVCRGGIRFERFLICKDGVGFLFDGSFRSFNRILEVKILFRQFDQRVCLV